MNETKLTKKRVRMSGIDMGSLAIGERAVIFLGGKAVLTSPVVSYFISSLGRTYEIETLNTVYYR